jgi:hypothetical protein
VFRVTGSYGFHVTFSNGVTASVQFSNDHCCSARHQSPRESSCPNAEVAFFRDKTWLTKEIVQNRRYVDDIIGHVSPDDLIPLLVAAAAYPAWTPIETMFFQGKALDIYGRVAGDRYDEYKAVFNGYDVVTSFCPLSRVVVDAYFKKFCERTE